MKSKECERAKLRTIIRTREFWKVIHELGKRTEDYDFFLSGIEEGEAEKVTTHLGTADFLSKEEVYFNPVREQVFIIAYEEDGEISYVKWLGLEALKIAITSLMELTSCEEFVQILETT